jgi:hypothetical protein
MGANPSSDVTTLLLAWNSGDQKALDRLMPLIYDELRRLARRHMRLENAGHTLQPTALVNDLYVQFIDQKRVNWQNRAHFFGAVAPNHPPPSGRSCAGTPPAETGRWRVESGMD